MTKTKSGRELEGTKGHKAPAWARRFFAWFGMDDGVSDGDSSDD